MFFIEFFRGVLNLFIPKKMKCIENQLALITGGGNGIGRSIAIKLAEKRCNIAIADIDISAAEKTVNHIIKTFKVKAKAFKVDVSDAECVNKLKIDIENSLGNLDILINNAGVLALDLSLREKSNERIMEVIKINLMSHFWVNNFT